MIEAALQRTLRPELSCTINKLRGLAFASPYCARLGTAIHPITSQLFGRQQTISDVLTLRLHVRTRQLNSDRPEGARRASDCRHPSAEECRVVGRVDR